MIDIAIIGGGPAGLTAGLYAARAGASVTLFEEIFVGGQAAKTDRIENYPGFVEGIGGGELGMQIYEQASRFGLNVRYEPIEKLELDGEIKRLHMKKGVEEARAVILAMGANPRKLGVEREEELIGGGISYCATCDGAFFKGCDVAVVGGGDTALSDALYLARFANKIYVIHRRDALRGTKVLQEAVLAESKIELVWDSVVTKLNGAPLSSVTVRNVKTKEEKDIESAALFVAVGVEPRAALISGQLEVNERGYIKTDARMRTSVKNVYAAGDIRDTPLRQVVTAAADGAIAATQALEELLS